VLRNKRFDEAKGILILLVVFGHLIEPQISNSLPVRRVYEFIYLFHMPAFVFISGYLFKIESETRTHCVRIIQNLVMPLVMFEAIYEGYTILTTGRPSVYFLDFAPYWTLWYLLSLIFLVDCLTTCANTKSTYFYSNFHCVSLGEEESPV